MSFLKTRSVLLLLALCGPAFAAETGPNGWRGDGTGKYPTANPPLDWGRVAKSVKELSAQARKPKDGVLPAKDAAIPDGVIRQWLVLGPFMIAEGGNADELLPNAETLSPDENEKAGELAWKSVTLETSCMDLCAIFNVPPDKKGMAAYAHAYIYSPSGGPVAYQLMFQGQGTNRAWLNGAALFSSPKNIDIPQGGRLVLNLLKGWNHLMILNTKTVNNYRKTWWTSGSFYGEKTNDYETRGIVWTTPLPSPGASAPVVIGDRLFFTAETGVVVCVNKADGKLLWMHGLTTYDFVTDEERKANADAFKELDPMAAKLKEIDKSELVTPYKIPNWPDTRACIETQMIQKMSKIAPKKYNSMAGYCEAGFTACNPVTDGTFVYALFGTGIVACYDRDGNLQWKRLLNHDPVEHGYTTSPVLVDGKLVVYFNNFTVLNAKTGEVILERPHYLPSGKAYTWYTHFHGTACVMQAGNEKVLYYPNGEFVRLSDGKTLTYDEKKFPMLGPLNRCATPVIENGVAYKLGSAGPPSANSFGGAVAFKLAAPQGDKIDPEIVQNVPFNLDHHPYYYDPATMASPLVHDGLLYTLDDFGLLTVVDMVKGEVLYQRLLNLEIFMPYNQALLLKGGASASPTLAGKYIYILGNQGTCLVLEPGRTYKQVAKLRLECFTNFWPAHQDVTMTAPIFEGERMYYKAESTLYCIGSK